MKTTFSIILMTLLFVIGGISISAVAQAHSGHIETTDDPYMEESYDDMPMMNQVNESYGDMPMMNQLQQHHHTSQTNIFWQYIIRATLLIWLIVGILAATFLITRLNK